MTSHSEVALGSLCHSCLSSWLSSARPACGSLALSSAQGTPALPLPPPSELAPRSTSAS
jgi:hypothetical protein